MPMTSERRPAVRTMRGWAIHVLQESGAIRECEEHRWTQDRADPHAQERAFNIAREDPPAGVSPDVAAAEVCDVLNPIGDACPECPPIRKKLDRTRVVSATSNVNANIRGRARTTAHVSGGLNISGHEGRRGNFSRMRQRQ